MSHPVTLAGNGLRRRGEITRKYKEKNQKENLTYNGVYFNDCCIPDNTKRKGFETVKHINTV